MDFIFGAGERRWDGGWTSPLALLTTSEQLFISLVTPVCFGLAYPALKNDRKALAHFVPALNAVLGMCLAVLCVCGVPLVEHLVVLLNIAFFWDLSLGFLFYREQMGILTEWVHHFGYFVIWGWFVNAQVMDYVPMFALGEFPVAVAKLGHVTPRLRNDALFGLTWLLLRIILHTIVAGYATFNREPLSILLIPTLWLHVHWFVKWHRAYAARFKTDSPLRHSIATVGGQTVQLWQSLKTVALETVSGTTSGKSPATTRFKHSDIVFKHAEAKFTHSEMPADR